MVPSRLVFHRLHFGEAAYAAQSVLSWQTTVVGDPLFQPFGKDPESLHLELERSGNKNLEWSYLRLANLNLANGKPVAEWVSSLESFDLTKKSAVLSEKLGDLYVQQGKPSSAVHSYSEALKLGPSPQQRIRLLLTLGEKLTSLDRAQEAYEKYQELLKLSDDYPDKATLYKKLIALAQKLSRPADVEKYEQESKRL